MSVWLDVFIILQLFTIGDMFLIALIALAATLISAVGTWYYCDPVRRARRQLVKLLAHADEAHDIHHADRVVFHVQRALAFCETKPSSELWYAIVLAALLHDADDRKLFPNSVNYANARRILRECWPQTQDKHQLVIDMIALCSTSKNKNALGD